MASFDALDVLDAPASSPWVTTTLGHVRLADPAAVLPEPATPALVGVAWWHDRVKTLEHERNMDVAEAEYLKGEVLARGVSIAELYATNVRQGETIIQLRADVADREAAIADLNEAISNVELRSLADREKNDRQAATISRCDVTAARLYSDLASSRAETARAREHLAKAGLDLDRLTDPTTKADA